MLKISTKRCHSVITTAHNSDGPWNKQHCAYLLHGHAVSEEEVAEAGHVAAGTFGLKGWECLEDVEGCVFQAMRGQAQTQVHGVCKWTWWLHSGSRHKEESSKENSLKASSTNFLFVFFILTQCSTKNKSCVSCLKLKCVLRTLPEAIIMRSAGQKQIHKLVPPLTYIALYLEKPQKVQITKLCAH